MAEHLHFVTESELAGVSITTDGCCHHRDKCLMHLLREDTASLMKHSRLERRESGGREEAGEMFQVW